MSRGFRPEEFTVKQLSRQLHISLAGAYEFVRVLDEAGMLMSWRQVRDGKSTVWYRMEPQGKRARLKKAE